MSLENVIYQGKTSDTFSGRSGNRKSDFRKLGFEVLAVLIVSYPEEVCSKVIVCSLEMAAGNICLEESSHREYNKCCMHVIDNSQLALGSNNTQNPVQLSISTLRQKTYQTYSSIQKNVCVFFFSRI